MMVVFFTLFFSQAYSEEVKGTNILNFDQPWQFWANTSSPPIWPITTSPNTFDALSLLAPDFGVSMDRWANLQVNGEFQTGTAWWTGFYAPFSIRTQKQFTAYLPEILKTQKTLTKKGLPHYSRTELIVDAEESGLESMFFYTTFQVDNPETFAALQIQSKFEQGLEVYLNDTLLLSYQIPLPPATTAPEYTSQEAPPWLQMNVGKSARWEYAWQGLPNVLKKGENFISVKVVKSEKTANPLMYFDLQLRGYAIEWLKEPYLMNPSSRSMVVGWESSVIADGVVTVCEVNAPQSCQEFSSTASTLHQITLQNLKSNTQYEYEASFSYQNQVYRYPKQKFRTLPSSQQKFSFYLYGDSRGFDNIHKKVADSIVAHHQKNSSLFVIHTGDMVTHGYIWDLWESKFFTPSVSLYRELPIVPVTGNHEQNQKLYYDYFNLPGNEAYYNFTQGNTEFFAINTNISFSPKSAQYKWFEEQLRKSTAKWKIVMFHHPPYSCSPVRKPGEKYVREYLVPLMERYGVDLVLLGHDHLYGRSRDINGIIYVTSGGGGAGLYPAEPDEFNPVCIKQHHFVYFSVSTASIDWVAIDIKGNVIDTYQITK